MSEGMYRVQGMLPVKNKDSPVSQEETVIQQLTLERKILDLIKENQDLLLRALTAEKKLATLTQDFEKRLIAEHVKGNP